MVANSCLETHAVRVPVIVRTRVRVASEESWPYLPDRDHTGWASVHTELTTGAHVIVDDEDHRICRIRTRTFSTRRCRDSIWSHHVDALPWADIDTPFTSDALRLIDVDELFRLHSTAEVIGVYFYEVIL